MYCSKCGKEVRNGDTFCSGCGSRIGSGSAPKKKNNGLVILLGIVVLVLAACKLFGGESAPSSNYTPVQNQQQSTLPQVQADTLPAEPNDGDVLEDSDYADGTPRRRISDYGDVYVTDYRPDGTMLRETILYYSDDVYGGKRVKNCDTHGNPTDETETMPDGTLWLYMYYKNSYDEQGRPLELAQYNRAGFPLYIYTYTYNADGSYRMDWTEYRGPVYEYDFEENSDGATTLAFEGYTTFTAQGDVVDQVIKETE